MNENETLCRSDITGKTYYASDVVRILNIYQVHYYLQMNVELLDVYPSKDRETDKPLLVFIFDRKASRQAYDLWCKRKLD